MLLYFIDIGLIEFAANLVVLAVIIGNTEVRAFYRQYLNAENRNDVEAMNLLQSELSEQGFATNVQATTNTSDSAPENAEQEVAQTEATDELADTVTIAPEPKPLSESLIWCNFKYYAAPIFYFVIFGLPGIVFYATALYLFESKSLKNRLPDNVISTLKAWNEWMFWLPARFVSVGFMFVGHFSNGLESYLKLAANFSVPAYQMITEVAHAAEGGHPQSNEKNMVKLAKRNMALFVVVVALLTLYGYIV
ncbi:regulatory signaling modulator protein AmpE [Psychrosphaera algicola]|uniref:Regulatory signaling modulator protein AmpE n=1 Tax=Psychrosphaera algicola TaxID=3023714 RepID=A0ABT5FCX0_9GAMM|nr:regulatory signaling modulator protein AmpE [Psychrosphaera sp. G1-22]MDC2889394.1 regulatory signaling modulator protein AmpE [Psychrosphaera sp. G1-22]